MLIVHVRGPDGRISQAPEPRAALANGGFIWVDFIAPTDAALACEEERLVEQALQIDAPTPQERAAFEDSARFYEEDGALFLTPTLMGQRTEGAFVSDTVAFILVRGVLVTVRTIAPRAFSIGKSRASARIESAGDGAGVLLALLEGVVERIADILQETSRNANAVSARIFSPKGPVGGDVLREIGTMGTLVSLSHASLSSLQRLATYSQTVCTRHGLPPDRLLALERDVQELERSAEALQGHLSFLLEAALGLVGAAQSNAIKALSLATIAFVPPTLVASFFGMNFAALAWIDEPWGPWLGLALMLIAPAALFVIAKRRNWF